MSMRPLKGTAPSGVMPIEYYPNAFAGSRRYPNPGDNTNPEGNGVRCAQCGYPIKDRNKAKSCPNCSSDNFDGQVLAK